MNVSQNKEPKNFREIRPKRSCASCIYCQESENITNGYMRCEKADPENDEPWGAPEYLYHFVCDKYKHENKLGLLKS